MDRSVLVAGAATVGVTLGPSEVRAFERYLSLLTTWNRRINLTAVRDPRDIVVKHFVDCLAVAPHTPADARTLVDVGSGAGFPGAVVALVRSELQVTLVESNQKKVAFLRTLQRELSLTRLTVRPDRADDLPDAMFDVAVSRATWNVPEWLEVGRRLVKPGGCVLAMEGAERYALPPGAARTPYALGDAQRAIVTLRVA